MHLSLRSTHSLSKQLCLTKRKLRLQAEWLHWERIPSKWKALLIASNADIHHGKVRGMQKAKTGACNRPYQHLRKKSPSQRAWMKVRWLAYGRRLRWRLICIKRLTLAVSALMESKNKSQHNTQKGTKRHGGRGEADNSRPTKPSQQSRDRAGGEWRAQGNCQRHTCVYNYVLPCVHKKEF